MFCGVPRVISKLKTFNPVLKDFGKNQANDLFGQFLPSIRMQSNNAIFPNLGRRRWQTKHWKDFPQPILKPMGNEDYDRWRKVLPHVKRSPAGRKDPFLGTQSETIPKEIFQRIDEEIKTETTGRLFAVVQLSGKQFKITTEDIIVVQGHFAPQIGDELQLEKVILVGSSDFTLVGRPLLNKDLLKVEATVIEKTLSHIIFHFMLKRRKQYRRTRFARTPFTMLRITNIQLREGINEIKDVEGLEDRIF